MEEGIEMKINDKGRAVYTTKRFAQGEFVVKYKGDYICRHEGEIRERGYQEEGKGCYLFFFSCGGKQLCINATAERPWLED